MRNFYVIDQEQVGPLTVKIVPDEDGPNPREEWDNAGHMVCFHRRYNLGDKQDDYRENDFGSWDELEQAILRDHPGAVVLPLYLYDHGGLRMKVGSFQGLLPQGHAEFDSGMVGYIWISREEILHEWGGGAKRVSPKLRARAETYLRGEVECYDAYLRGDVVGFVVEDEEGEHLDSCWGFVGDREQAMDEGVRSAKWHLEERAKQEAELRRTNLMVRVWEGADACV